MKVSAIKNCEDGPTRDQLSLVDFGGKAVFSAKGVDKSERFKVKCAVKITL
jgi:hypothetical protein